MARVRTQSQRVHGFAGVDWERALLPDTPVLELVVRGSAMYPAMFVLLRPVPKREAGSVGITDLLVVVLLADAAANGMTDDHASIPDGLIPVGTIVFWAWALNWLGYRFAPVERLGHPQPLPLVRDGRRLRRNMNKELITEDELLSQLRHEGVDDVGRVKAAFMEGDGSAGGGNGDGQESPAARPPVPRPPGTDPSEQLRSVGRWPVDDLDLAPGSGRWEYAALTRRGSDAAAFVGSSHRDRRVGRSWDLVRALGDEGWELVAAAGAPNAYGGPEWRYAFKRRTP